MGLREKLEDKNKKKEEEIQGLESKISEAKAYVQGLQEAMRLLPRDSTGRKSAESSLRPGSKVYKTLEFLKKKGKPMHITEILKGIGLGTTKNEKVSLSGSLGWYVRNNEIFDRPSPNTFGLLSIDKDSLLEPPDEFGLEAEEEKKEFSEEDIPF